ncbi:MAG: tetratricopeptide repeat protein [Gammaproteobacteria bacterium]|nr:tetratricopeptide repeat protein [Gammaproteobacteria bacterium]
MNGEYDSAIRLYTLCIQSNYNVVSAYNNRGMAYKNKHQYDLAIRDYSKVIELNPKYVGAYYNRGNAYSDKHQYDLAIRDFNTAIDLDPTHTDAYNDRGMAYKNKRQYDLAIRDYNKVIELNPEDAHAYYNRGNAYIDKHQYDLAIHDYNKAIELNPEDAKVYNNMAWFRATCAEKKYRNGAEAVRLAIKANELTSWGNNNHLDTLAASYAEAGMFEKAIETQEKAISLLDEEERTRPDHGYQKRLALFRSRVPFHD